MSGVCGSEPGPDPNNTKIPTSKACTKEDVCKDGNATCTTYDAGTPAGTYCLLPEGGKCAKNADCENASCLDGVCKQGNRPPVPTGQACGAGDVCADVLAECVPYDSGNPVGTYCLLQETEPCAGNNDCQSQLCAAGTCKAKIPLAQACAQDDVCRDALAECTTYQSGQPSGTYCLLAEGEATCAADDDCITQVCSSGTCGAYQPGLAAVCGATSAQQTCKASANATCQQYTSGWTNATSDEYFCTRANGESCPVDIGDCACQSSGCNSGTCCDIDNLTPNNKLCSSDSDCCSNICKNFGELTPYTEERCIGQDQLWWRLTYTASNAIQANHMYSPDNVPGNWNSTTGTYLMGPFETGGGAFIDNNQWILPSERANTVPTGPGNRNNYPNGDGDPYCRKDGNVPYTALKMMEAFGWNGREVDHLVAHSEPGDKIRVLYVYEGQCNGDSYSVDACGPNWNSINTATGPIWQQGTPTVKFYQGLNAVGSDIVIQPPPGTPANPERYYWWWVADVIFDETNTPHVIPVNTLHQCLPTPYALDGGTVTNGLRAAPYIMGEQDDSGYTNWCDPIPYLTPTP